MKRLALLLFTPFLFCGSAFSQNDPLRGPAWTVAKRMWEMADMTPADVKVAQLYDAFSPLIILSLEGYGFCERGEGGPFTDNGGIEWGTGRLPVNSRATHGPPNSPGGRLMPCRTIRSGAMPAGLSSKNGDSTCRTPTIKPVLTSMRMPAHLAIRMPQ